MNFRCLWYKHFLQHDNTNVTKWHVCPAKTQISLGIRPVWSESYLYAQWVAKDPRFPHADGEDSDQTGWMPRLIWVFARCTSFCWFCHAAAQMINIRHTLLELLAAVWCLSLQWWDSLGTRPTVVSLPQMPGKVLAHLAGRNIWPVKGRKWKYGPGDEKMDTSFVWLMSLQMSQLMRFWYLGLIKAVRAVLPEPSLFTHEVWK